MLKIVLIDCIINLDLFFTVLSHFVRSRAVMRVDKYHQKPAGLKVLSDAKAIIKAKILDAESSGFTLAFECVNYDRDVILLNARKPEIRTFTTLEAAVSFCRRELNLKGGIEVLA
jgi:hypothetical protein